MQYAGNIGSQALQPGVHINYLLLYSTIPLLKFIQLSPLLHVKHAGKHS